MEGASAALCYRQGLTISKALFTDRSQTKLILFSALKRLWRAVRVGDDKTWQTDEDVQDCVDDIIDIYRTMKMEEVMYVLIQIRRGGVKIFGRLDTPTILEALGKHDVGVSTSFREAQHQGRTPIIQHFDALKEIAKELPKGELSLQEKFAQPSKISEDERKAMRTRDRERNSGQTEGEAG